MTEMDPTLSTPLNNTPVVEAYPIRQLKRPLHLHPLRALSRREIGDKITQSQFVDCRIRSSKGDFYRKNLSSHFGCINAIEFTNDGSLLASGGDDRRILLWNVHKAIIGNCSPVIMQAEHLSNVFAIAFDCTKSKIISAGNDDRVVVHDISTGAPIDFFLQEQPIYGVSGDPVNTSIFSTACDDGRILIYDMRESTTDPFCLAKLHSSFHSVMFHPTEPRFILTANTKEGAALWDVRMNKRPVLKYGRQSGEQCCMNARFNQTGSQVLALRRRRPPILYSTHSTSHLFQFNHSSYYNSCTMKSCCFGGTNDQFVISGSDNFDVHAWEIPNEGSSQWVNEAKVILKGHRSIVNQVRYNYAYNVLASSGVEKVIKLWSPFALPDESCWENGDSGLMTETPRKIHSHEEYIRLILRSGNGHFSRVGIAHDGVRGRSTTEDSRMMAFFDALVQRDIAGLSEDDTEEDSTYTNTVYSTEETSSEENHTPPSLETSPSLTSNGNSQPLPLVADYTDNNDNDATSGGGGGVDIDDLPIVNSSDSDDASPNGIPTLSPPPPNDPDSSLSPLDHDEIRQAVLREFNASTNTRSEEEDESGISVATAEPNTLTKMIAKKGHLLRRLASDKRVKKGRSTSTSTKRQKFSRSAAAKRTLRAMDATRSSSDEGEEDHQNNSAVDPYFTTFRRRQNPTTTADLGSPVRMRERRQSQTTPVYESSNNINPNTEPGPSYQQINDLLTRNPTFSEDYYAVHSSSSSSSSTITSLSSSDNESKSRNKKQGDKSPSSTSDDELPNPTSTERKRKRKRVPRSRSCGKSSKKVVKVSSSDTSKLGGTPSDSGIECKGKVSDDPCCSKDIPDDKKEKEPLKNHVDFSTKKNYSSSTDDSD